MQCIGNFNVVLVISTIFQHFKIPSIQIRLVMGLRKTKYHYYAEETEQ